MSLKDHTSNWTWTGLRWTREPRARVFSADYLKGDTGERTETEDRFRANR